MNLGVSLSPAELNLTASGGSFSFDLAVNPSDMSWRAEANEDAQDWCDVTPKSGTGNSKRNGSHFE